MQIVFKFMLLFIAFQFCIGLFVTLANAAIAYSLHLAAIGIVIGIVSGIAHNAKGKPGGFLEGFVMPYKLAFSVIVTIRGRLRKRKIKHAKPVATVVAA